MSIVHRNPMYNQINLPKEIIYCTKCVIPNQRPRIAFDDKGVCSACSFSEFKRNCIDWELREKELEQLCDKFRRSDGYYDVVVPSSGGKDSGFVAHKLKYQYGMNPLTVTWSPLKYTDIGRVNFDNFINIGGFDNVFGRASGKVYEILAREAFIQVGDPFQPFIYGQSNFPLRVAVQYNIPLIMYGENGEVEYGGDMQNAYKPDRSVEDQIKHYFKGVTPHSLAGDQLSDKDLLLFCPPSLVDVKRNNTEVHFFSYYHFWDPQENFYYCNEHTGFVPNPERNEGTYSKYASIDDRMDGFHYYMMFIKFGFGRATSDAAHEIRDGKITREEGVNLVKKYDGEWPEKHYEEFREFTDMTDEEIHEVIDSWRPEHIWEKDGSQWRLRKPVWVDSDDTAIDTDRSKAAG